MGRNSSIMLIGVVAIASCGSAAPASSSDIVNAVAAQGSGSSNNPMAVRTETVTEPFSSLEEVSAIPAAYLSEHDRLDGVELDVFMADPASILATHPNGGSTMSNYVRLLAGSDGRTISTLIDIAKTANSFQVVSIGAGLSRATLQSAASAPKYAAYIQGAVARSGMAALIQAYSVALADPETSELSASSAGPTGGSVGSVGSLSGTADVGGSGTANGDRTVVTTSGSFPINGGSISALGGGRTVVNQASSAE